ncbi:MAG: ABC transporter ATP-binding protein, partial [Acidimicrobiales bacterium]
MSGGPLLAAEGLTVHHGQLRALDHVDLEVQPGDTYAIIGANGAGKSTLLRTIAGLHRPTEGRVVLDGRDVSHDPPDRRLKAGIALVPEGRRLFPSLTVEENLLVGMYRARPGPFDLDRVYGLFEWMAGRRKQRASQLSGGEQQAVAICRALLANPRVLLLDELSLGLAPIVVARIYEVLPTLVGEGLTVLLVEQDVAQARRVASRVQCLLEGTTSLLGRPGELTAEQIERAYFGVGGVAGTETTGAGPAPGGTAGAAIGATAPGATAHGSTSAGTSS